MGASDTVGRLERLELLSSRLKSEEPLTVEILARELGVSRRTLFRDLSLLRERGLPVESDVGRGGGVRLDRSWGIGRLQLSYREAVELLVSLAVAERMEAPWLIANLASIRKKLVASFSPAVRSRVRGLTKRIHIGPSASLNVQQTFVRPDAASAEALCRGFVEGRILRFRYRDGQQRKSRRRVEPHFLFLNYPVWYLVAWDEGREAVRSFRLDRMSGVQAEESGFQPRADSLFVEALCGERSVLT